ncbi:hypothetical protein K7X08_011912 [Anisodus acutangulus]|uniref:HMG box domain-containing protein n=1 Tax=Anisodus acutangulus TaxID=402998 RepID=A0A9Q1LCH7_9SOLA|nr:hypothetical protein K7X08_011912 [Anisodus acutangulus]
MAAGYAEEEESDRPMSEVDPSSGSNDGENPCCSHLGDKFNVKAYKMICLKKKAQALDVFKGLVRDLNNPKRPLGKWKHMSDVEKAPYMAVAEKMRVEYAKIVEAYNRRMAAGYALEEESDKSSKQFPEIESIVALGAAGGGKWNQMSDVEKAPYIAEEKKRKMEYENIMNGYNRRVVVADTEEEESDESRSEFDEEVVSGEEEEDDDLSGEGKWNQMSDVEKAPYIAEEKKMMMEYEKIMNGYNRRVVVADTEEEESDESRSEFDEEEVSGEEEDDDDLCNLFDV